MPKVVWTRQSREDLKAIQAFIARDAPRTATTYIRRLMASTWRLRRFPLLGAVVPELQREDIREILFGNYRLIYRAGKKAVEILTVFHAARLLHQEDVAEEE